MKRVTLKDIASELNVTVGTVSHALNDMDDISEPMKQKVRQTARRMGYVTDSVASSLRSGKTNTVAIIVPDISNQLFSRQIKRIEAEAKSAGYTTIILNTNEDDEAEHEAIVTAYKRRVDGILLCPAQHSSDNIAFLSALKIPFVLFDRYFRDVDTNYVCSDDVKGGYIAASYLLERGYTKIAYVGAYQYLECSQDRYSGVQRACAEHGMTLPRCLETDPQSGYGDEIVNTLMVGENDFDSLVVFSDLLAFDIRASLIASRSEKAEVPIVSFDATQSYMRLPFSHVSVGMVDDSLAREAFSILKERMSSPSITGTENLLID